jgi:hypothetical protein
MVSNLHVKGAEIDFAKEFTKRLLMDGTPYHALLTAFTLFVFHTYLLLFILCNTEIDSAWLHVVTSSFAALCHERHTPNPQAQCMIRQCSICLCGGEPCATYTPYWTRQSNFSPF